MTDQDENIGQMPQTPLLIHAQYLKDLSFENPNAPGILQKGDNPPKMEMDIGLNVKRLEHDKHEHFYEVVLSVNAGAKRPLPDGEEKTMFLAECVYGAAVSITGLEEKRHHPLLFTEVPHMIFPFVRQIMAGATQAGGYIPLQLNPVDFRAMYIERFANKGNGAEEAGESAA
ncbi:MAG: protein-export chaperone SecB [Alphaproteobacteria bacterium]|nr:protein-export chaperone SecB [Alphaproteobacteria bacterium]